MQRQMLLRAAMAASAAFGCSAERSSSSSNKPEPALLALETRSLPAETARATFFDFGGKIALVGYELGSTGPVKAGDELGLTLYWQTSAPLEPGWELTTEVLSNGKVLDSRAEGALRGGADSPLAPSGFRPGRLYKDEVKVKLPGALPDAEISLVAGVQRTLPAPNAESLAPVFRLPVLSGPSDGHDRAVVAHLPATVTQKAAPKANERQRRSRRRDSAPAPSAAPSAR